ncbi:MAG: hypothetical protein K5787_01645 [Lentisphaeria bacterium]|nr:hypothetical protein [Lentisphaeria bacterium]
MMTFIPYLELAEPRAALSSRMTRPPRSGTGAERRRPVIRQWTAAAKRLPP